MSLQFEFFTPNWHRWRGVPLFDAWFYRPDEQSTGGVGFRLPILRVCFMWGLREPECHPGSRA